MMNNGTYQTIEENPHDVESVIFSKEKYQVKSFSKSVVAFIVVIIVSIAVLGAKYIDHRSKSILLPTSMQFYLIYFFIDLLNFFSLF